MLVDYIELTEFRGEVSIHKLKHIDVTYNANDFLVEWLLISTGHMLPPTHQSAVFYYFSSARVIC